MARAVLDQLAGNEIEDSAGDKRGDLRIKALTDVDGDRTTLWGNGGIAVCCEGQHTEGKHPVTVSEWCCIRGRTDHWAVCRTVGGARLHAERTSSHMWL